MAVAVWLYACDCNRVTVTRFFAHYIVGLFTCLLNRADESVKSSAVVDAVAQLCESRERFMQQLTDILQVDEADRYVSDCDDGGGGGGGGPGALRKMRPLSKF